MNFQKMQVVAVEFCAMAHYVFSMAGVYGYNPDGDWTSRHQTTLNGKADGFTLDDLKAVAKTAMMKNGRVKTTLAEVTEAVGKWVTFAEQADVAGLWRKKIAATHRTEIS